MCGEIFHGGVSDGNLIFGNVLDHCAFTGCRRISYGFIELQLLLNEIYEDFNN